MTTHRRIASRLAATTVLVLATGAPSALAHPAQALYGPAGRPNQEKQVIVAQPASAPATVVRVDPANPGFDWGDAGIGAIGGLAVSLIGVGGALVLSQHRPHRRETDLAS